MHIEPEVVLTQFFALCHPESLFVINPPCKLRIDYALTSVCIEGLNNLVVSPGVDYFAVLSRRALYGKLERYMSVLSLFVYSFLEL